MWRLVLRLRGHQSERSRVTTLGFDPLNLRRMGLYGRTCTNVKGASRCKLMFFSLIATRLNLSIKHFQNVIVMRHGDRIDNFEPLWVSQAARPWDPPLIQAGKDRAFYTGTKLRSDLGFQINRVFVSPFIRCVETAVQVVTAFSASEHPTLSRYESDQPLPVDPSKLKVSIEYGLCEMLNKEAIRGDLAPKDGQRWGFNIAELEALFPAGTVDQTVERVYKELPQWGESVTGARARYAEVIQALADKYPTENLLLVTHGEGVGSSISLFLEGATVYEVNYCAYSELRRPVFDKDQPTTAGKFEVVKNLRQTGLRYSQSGLRYLLEIADTGDLSLPSE